MEVPTLRCRRCDSRRLILLEKKHPEDNNIYRCQECGFLFSPPEAAQIKSGLNSEALGEITELPRTAPMRSGYARQE